MFPGRINNSNVPDTVKGNKSYGQGPGLPKSPGTPPQARGSRPGQCTGREDVIVETRETPLLSAGAWPCDSLYPERRRPLLSSPPLSLRATIPGAGSAGAFPILKTSVHAGRLPLEDWRSLADSQCRFDT